jgi:hypothetical protein
VRIAEGPSYFFRSGESLAEERLEREKLARDKTDVAAQLARVKLEKRLHEEILRHTESLSMTHTTTIKSKDKGGSAASLSAERSVAGDAPSEGDYVERSLRITFQSAESAEIRLRKVICGAVLWNE